MDVCQCCCDIPWTRHRTRMHEESYPPLWKQNENTIAKTIGFSLGQLNNGNLSGPLRSFSHETFDFLTAWQGEKYDYQGKVNRFCWTLKLVFLALTRPHSISFGTEWILLGAERISFDVRYKSIRPKRNRFWSELISFQTELFTLRPKLILCRHQ